MRKSRELHKESCDTLPSINSQQTRDHPSPHLSGGSAVSLIYHTSLTWGYPFGSIIQRGFAKKPLSTASLARKLGRELSWSQPSGQETSPVAPNGSRAEGCLQPKEGQKWEEELASCCQCHLVLRHPWKGWKRERKREKRRDWQDGSADKVLATKLDDLN